MVYSNDSKKKKGSKTLILKSVVPEVCLRARFVLQFGMFSGILLGPALAQNPGCTTGQAWTIQSNAQTDPTGKYNVDYPETNAFDWITVLPGNLASAVSIYGQFPLSRYMSLELYSSGGTVVAGINGSSIVPGPGQSNPFVSGTAQGTYTVFINGGAPPRVPAPNTLYTSGQTGLELVYRIYYPTVAGKVTGSTTDPVLPTLSIGGAALSTCPPEQIISPVTSTAWGRLDQTNFVGVPPPQPLPASVTLQLASLPVTNPPTYITISTNTNTPFFPSDDNSYLITMLSREYLNSPYTNNLAVIRFQPPTFPNTQAGAPASAPGQVRYWSVCTDDVISTAVIRCAADNQSTNVNGFVTYVISDPGQKPSSSTLSQWGATWIAWGALESTDALYNQFGQTVTNANGVLWYNPVIYRQTESETNWLQSIRNVSSLPASMQPVAMGAYWPTVGYCTSSAFEALGAGCL